MYREFPLHTILFRRRTCLRLLLLSILFIMSSVVRAQSDILNSEVKLAQRYSGSTDSLISIISRQLGITVSYSSKVYANEHISLDSHPRPLGDVLGEIFSRFPVEYVVRNRKVIVAPARIRLFTLSGYVKDALTNEALIGANVYDTLLYIGQATNGYGFYSFTLPEGKAAVRASFVGYNTFCRTVALHSDTIINISLAPSIIMKDIEVVADERGIDRGKLGIVDLPLDQIKSMPSLLGEVDVIKALESTPGVQCGEEGFGGMSVRGGSADQNIVMLDEVPLYSPNHLMGLYSVFNSESVNSATLVKGGFPARYGGRMSSVLDVRMKEGNMKKFSGYVNIGLLASNATLEGPIIKDRMSFIVSARRTYFDILGSQLQRNNDNRYSFNFYDIHAKLNYAISPRDHLYVSFFTGYDNLRYGYNYRDVTIDYGGLDQKAISINDSQKVGWGNIVTSARWNHLFGYSLFANSTVAFSRYRFRNTFTNYADDDEVHFSNEYYSGINDVSGRLDFNWYTPFIPGSIKFGSNVTYHSFYPGISIYTSSHTDASTDTISSKADGSFYSLEMHHYLEDELSAGPFTANAGIHVSMLHRAGSDTYARVEPRLLLGYELSKNIHLKLGYADMTQFIHLLRMVSVASPADMWMPVAKNMPLPHSRQLSAEVNISLSKNVYFTLEGYHKRYINYQTYRSSLMTESIVSDGWSNIYALGKGRVDGVEFFLHRKAGRLSGWLGYALSKGRNSFDKVDNGREYPMDNDRTHSASFYICYKVNDDVDITSSYTYSTGAPVTISDGRYMVMGSNSTVTFPMEGIRNASRMPASSTLNIGANIYRSRGTTERKISFGVYNLLARKNPMFVYWSAKDNNGSDVNIYKLKQFSLIAWPWPYIKYSIKF